MTIKISFQVPRVGVLPVAVVPGRVTHLQFIALFHFHFHFPFLFPDQVRYNDKHEEQTMQFFSACSLSSSLIIQEQIGIVENYVSAHDRGDKDRGGKINTGADPAICGSRQLRVNLFLYFHFYEPMPPLLHPRSLQTITIKM